jgi:hypothetical protein
VNGYGWCINLWFRDGLGKASAGRRWWWRCGSPFEDISDAADWLDAVPLSEADRVKISGENAIKLFKLKLS